MSKFSAKHSKRFDAKQAVREARKAANRALVPDNVELLLETEDGKKYYLHKHIAIPGYTYAF